MPKLPERAWLLLSDAADFIVERCECSIDDARAALLGGLRDGLVSARGTHPNTVYKRAVSQGYNRLDWERAFPAQVGRPIIPKLFWWHDPDWQTNKVGAVINVEVDRASLLQWLGGDGAVPEPETGRHPQDMAPTPQENNGRPDYTPPYVAFMLLAKREMGLEPNTRTPKETIEGWLRENWPDHLGESTKRKIERMATFLRHPEDERGGHFKPNRDE